MQTNLSEQLEETWFMIEKAHDEGNQSLKKFATGFYDFDTMTQGFQAGDLITLASRSGMGKTSLALGMASNIAQLGSKVGFVSLGMPHRKIVLKLLSSKASIEVARLETGNVSENEWAGVSKALEILTDLPLLILDKEVHCQADLIQKVREQKELGLDILFVDYIQLLIPDSDYQVNAISRIARSLKLLALELNIPIVCLSQVDKACEKRVNKRPMLGDINDGLAEDSDMVITIYIDSYYNPDSPDFGIAEVHIIKNRVGPTGVTKLLSELYLSRFKNLITPRRYEAIAQWK
jgi:replicative DNA helicase